MKKDQLFLASKKYGNSSLKTKMIPKVNKCRDGKTSRHIERRDYVFSAELCTAISRFVDCFCL